ncbi:MAG: ketopantoate reductase family protein, partial [Thermodesulfobacteriota bacterium]
MNILILGAGALGTLFGARLAENHLPVSLLSRNREHAQKIRETGVILQELDGTRKTVHVPVCCSPEELTASPDLVLVMVKSYDTQSAVNTIREECHENTIFLTLQNGIGNRENIEKHIDAGKILLGTTAQGATFVGPGEIRHGGNGITVVGEPDGKDTPRLNDIADIFLRAGLECRTSSCILDLIWHKLLINVGINALTALLQTQNGWLARDEEAQKLCVEAVLEAVQVAKARGISVPENPVQEVFNVAGATSTNTSSMLQDILKGKPTEIDAMNGAIVEIGSDL